MSIKIEIAEEKLQVISLGLIGVLVYHELPSKYKALVIEYGPIFLGVILAITMVMVIINLAVFTMKYD